MAVIVDHHISGIGDGIGDGKDISEFPLKTYSDKTDKLLIMDASGVVNHSTTYGVTAMEKGNWGHSGAAVSGFSSALPYTVIANTNYNLTTDKGGYVVEHPHQDTNFRWDTTTQRFYSSVSVLGGACYYLRAVVGFQLDTPKKGETIYVDINVFTSSATGTPADAHFTVETLTRPIPDSGVNYIGLGGVFFGDSDTFTHGVGFQLRSSSAGTVDKHSIMIARIS